MAAVVDAILLKNALKPHIPLIRFPLRSKSLQSTTKLFPNAKHVWYQNRPKRPIFSVQEIDTINVLIPGLLI